MHDVLCHFLLVVAHCSPVIASGAGVVRTALPTEGLAAEIRWSSGVDIWLILLAILTLVDGGMQFRQTSSVTTELTGMAGGLLAT